MASTSTTTTSLDIPDLHLHSSTPPEYLQRMIMTTLQRKGFEAAEAGALAEMERLLENHVQALFSNAMNQANLAGRSSSNVIDLLESQESTSWSPRSLRNESKRRRKRIPLETTPSTLEPPSDPVLNRLEDLREFLEESNTRGLEDVKPDITNERAGGKKGKIPDYAFEGAPCLPGRWTYPPLEPEKEVEEQNGKEGNQAQLHVTQASLDFVKVTAAERGDIDPALGIVDYRRSGFGAGQGRKRKWGVKGVEVA